MRIIPNKRLIIVLTVLFWAELSLLPFFSVKGVRPDLPAILLTFYAFRINWKRLTVFALIIGLIQDLLTNSFFGLNTVSYVAGSIALEFFALRFDRDKLWIQMASLFNFTLLTLFIFLILSFVVQRPHRLDEWMFFKMCGISIYTVFLGLILFPVLDHWLKIVFRSRQYELF